MGLVNVNTCISVSVYQLISVSVDQLICRFIGERFERWVIIRIRVLCEC